MFPDRTATVDPIEGWKQPTIQKGSVVGQQIQSPDQAIAGSAPRPFCVRAMPVEQWLRTPQAAIACGVSERTLKRLRGDVLEEGIHYRAASAASPSARGREAPQPAAAAKDPGDLSHASPPFRERSEVQETGGHQQSLPGCAEKGEAPRQRPKTPVGSGFDVDSGDWKPGTIPPFEFPDAPFFS